MFFNSLNPSVVLENFKTLFSNKGNYGNKKN